MQKQIDGTGETIVRNQDILEAAFKLQDSKINATKQAVIGNQHTINRLIERMQDVQRSIMNAQKGSKNEIEMVHQIILAQGRILASILKGVVGQITTLQSMRHDVAQYYQAVQLVTRGHIPASLIPPVER